MSRHVRSCQIVDSLSTGGAERLVALQAVEMSRAGHDVHVVSLAKPVEGVVSEQLAQSSVPVIHVPAHGPYSLLDRDRLRSLTAVVADLEPEIVHLHLDTAVMVGSAAARHLGIPALATLHASAPDFQRLGAVKRPFLHRALRRLDRVIAVGPQVAATWRDVVPSIEPTVVVTPVTELGEMTDRRPGLVGFRPVNLIAVGRLVHQKAYEVLIEAMRIVVASEPTVRCRIAGEGPERPTIEAAIALQRLHRNVELLGNRTDVDRLLAAADIFVSSSASEGLPVSVLEAMASGLPIVATDVGDVRAAVPVDAGIIVAPDSPVELADAILAMIKDPDRRLRFGAVGRRHVEANHNPERWAGELVGIYRQMLMSAVDSGGRA